MTWDAETRAIVEDVVKGITHHYDNDRLAIAAALAEIDRLERTLRHIRWWVINGNTPVLARLAMIEQTVLQALGDRLYEENGAD